MRRCALARARHIARMSLRLFAAIAIPDEVVDRLAPLMRGVGGAKWRPPENLHLTLRFFGEVTEPIADEIDTALSTVADATAPFDLTLKTAGSFGGADPHTLYIGAAENMALNKLAADCERAARRAGMSAEKRGFTPHVTLAYLSGASLDRVQAFVSRLGLFAAPPFRVERFGLYSSWTRKSAPSLYRLEAEYPLLG
ncbi:MAG: RNA 2',3'-cyclic phosphodiesterase [Hyphomonadaceae bacterium]|nr:RNA 2',3'-cyclic phosphodiesterase [Hyphomonadaceae bacterium]